MLFFLSPVLDSVFLCPLHFSCWQTEVLFSLVVQKSFSNVCFGMCVFFHTQKALDLCGVCYCRSVCTRFHILIDSLINFSNLTGDYSFSFRTQALVRPTIDTSTYTRKNTCSKQENKEMYKTSEKIDIQQSMESLIENWIRVVYLRWILFQNNYLHFLFAHSSSSSFYCRRRHSLFDFSLFLGLPCVVCAKTHSNRI